MEDNIENSNYKISRTSNGMEKIYKKIRLPWNIIKMLVKDRIQYPERLIVDITTTLSRCGVMIILYWYIFKLNKGIIHNTSFVTVVWSMFFYFSFLLFHFRDISTTIMRDVQTGSIEVLFSKPVSYILYRIWWQIGSCVYSFVTITIVSALALFFIIGLPPAAYASVFLPTLFLTLVCGSILAIFIYMTLGLLSFWIEDINPVRWMIDKALLILGGSYLPVAFFPKIMYQIALWSPFGSSLFVTHTVYDSWQTGWLKLVSIQIFWIIIMGLITFFVFKKARRRLFVNGG